jgi:anti-sigma factor RsiW
MKPENLETLMLDRALGELPPAVMELLDEYLTRNPDAGRHADTLTATLQLARQAVALPPETPQRPLEMDTLRRAQRTWRWRGLTQEALRLAACAVLGLALGWYAHASRPTPAAPGAQSFVLAQSSSDMGGTPMPRGTGVSPVGSSDGASIQKALAAPAAPRFWSLAKLQAEQRSRPAAASHQESRYQLQWDSPMKMPRVVEDKL